MYDSLADKGRRSCELWHHTLKIADRDTATFEIAFMAASARRVGAKRDYPRLPSNYYSPPRNDRRH
jgi:hypothetical protein